MFRLRTIAKNGGPWSTPIGVAQAVRICAFSLLLGCFEDDPSGPSFTPLPTGSVVIRTTTTGRDVDADGYLVRVDNDAAKTRVGANGSLTIKLRVGSHRVLLHEVAPNCQADVLDVVVAIAAAGETATVDVRVTCTAFGTVQVTLVTTGAGADLDANGYRILVSGGAAFTEFQAAVTVAVTGTTTVPGRAAGRHLVRLQDVAPNCGGPDLAPKEVDVVSDGTVAVSFQLACTTPNWLAFSADGAVGNSDIYVVRSNHADLTRLTTEPGKDEDPAWSPDGARIAFTSDRDGPRAIYVMRQDGSGVTRLTLSVSQNYRPAWSPDGGRIAFVSERDDGNAEVYVMNADGSNQARLTNHPAADGDPAWSPDGTRIAFTSKRDVSAKIYVMNADGSAITRITTSETSDAHPAWSPDGGTVAFNRMQCYDGRYPNSCYPAVMLTTPSGSAPTEIGIGDDPSWSPDGARIATTRFLCDFYYYYYDDPCTLTGIGIVSPLPIGKYGYTEIWEAELTRGIHRNPVWRP